MIKRLLGMFFIKLEDFRNTCIYSICRKKCKLNESFHFNGSNILLYGEGDIMVCNDSYIGANNVVDKSIEKNTIVGGVPARVLTKKNTINV